MKNQLQNQQFFVHNSLFSNRLLKALIASLLIPFFYDCSIHLKAGENGWGVNEDSTTTKLRVLAFSAHPDDEDGATLSYYAEMPNTETYSIFFTRGEGGQNEIGSALYDELAYIRTNETYRAASQLGTETFFLGFEDFGFSKTATETFQRWGGKNRVIEHVVYAIRLIQPDIIISNHDTITTKPFRQHGNHQAVGISIFEAFEKAADSTFCPHQFRNGIRPWQTSRLFTRIFRDSAHASILIPVDSLVETQGKTHDTIIEKETYRNRAFRALAEHKSQGMDKISPITFPFFYLPHRYWLTRSRGENNRTGLRLEEGLSINKKIIYPLREWEKSGYPFQPMPPLLLFASPQVMLKKRIEEDAYSPQFPVRYRREIEFVAVNATGEILPVLLTAHLVSPKERRLIAQRSYLFAREKRFRLKDTLSVWLEADPKFESIRVELSLKPINSSDTERFRKVEKTLFIAPVLATKDSSMRPIGLIETYDRTLRDFFAQMEIDFTPLDSLTLEKTVKNSRLKAFQTLIVDLRAHLYRPDIVKHRKQLLEYVEKGGHLIVFYHKPKDWKEGELISPFPIELTSERVTEETAPVKILTPKHRFFNFPNRLEPTDWQNWVQERAVYLPSGDTAKTSPKFERLLEINDTNDPAPPTSILTARYGKGRITYISLALYRQLRIWQNGAVRLFLNLISDEGRLKK